MIENPPAVRLVSFLISHRNVQSIQEDFLEASTIFADVLRDTGFKFDHLVCTTFLDTVYDTEMNGEQYPINPSSAFCVKAANGDSLREATGWLNCVVELAYSELNSSVRSAWAKVDVEIARSQPLTPIRLTRENDDFLEESPVGGNRSEFLVDHYRDNCRIGIPINASSVSIGIHSTCKGVIDRIPSSLTSDALLCRKCHLRVPIPNGTQTLGDLRKSLPQRAPRLGSRAPRR